VSRTIPVDQKTPGVVARYMARPPITPARLRGDARHAGVIDRSDAVYSRRPATLRVFAPLDLLAEASAHTPDPHEKTTLFYRGYSNRTRGYRKEHGLLGDARLGEPAPGENAQEPLALRRSWARPIH
jgi:hypothetical protein